MSETRKYEVMGNVVGIAGVVCAGLLLWFIHAVMSH